MTDRDVLAPYLRHGATCYLQAIRDNPPGDMDCTCGLRDVWLAAEPAEGLDRSCADRGGDHPSGHPWHTPPAEHARLTEASELRADR